jgi:alpha-mannosidase
MRTIHIVSHTHWDREWYLTFQQFRLKLVHLIDGLLEILARDPEFKYFMLDGQTIVLEDYLAVRPEKESVLREHVKKGRILIGPWHVLPDMFLVGPEAHIRNLLQGEHTCRRFGGKMKIGYMPDSFGHVGQIPQILRGFGIEIASVWRGVSDEPAEFWWQSPDGSRVLMAYLREGYGNGAELAADDPPRFAESLAEKGEQLAANSVTPDLLVMYGIDHMEPPRNTSEAIAYADEMLRDAHVIHSTLPQYVAAVQEDLGKRPVELPTVIGELRACKRTPLLPGVLSTRIWIKQRNRASENLLTKWAEPFTTWQELVTGQIGAALDQKSPVLRQSWHLLMENHPHDSICGCSIDQVHDEMIVRFDQVDQIGEELIGQSLVALASSMDTRPQIPDERTRFTVVVFNPTGSVRTDALETTLELPADVQEFELLDETGKSLPYQTRGLGNRELINLRLNPKELRSSLAQVNEGRAAGMSIQALQIRRDGGEVTVEAIMVEGGDPNLTAWQNGMKEIDACLADPQATTYNVHVRSASTNRLVFSAPEIPGLGWRTFWVRTREQEEKEPVRLNPLLTALLPLARLPIVQSLAVRKHHATPPVRIENETLVVEAKRDGTLTVQDKRNGAIYTGLNRFRDGGDCGDEYNYSPPDSDRMVEPRLIHVSLECGPVQQSLRLELLLHLPAALAPDRKSRSKERVAVPLTSTVTLSNGVPRVDITTEVDNQARDHRLRVHFPTPFAVKNGAHDGAFEVVERPVGVPAFDEAWVEQPRPEVPQRAFSDISDGRLGLMIANRGLPEVEILNTDDGISEIALTLLRCVGWLSRDDFSTRKGHAGPSKETPKAQLPGKWKFDYAIIPHAGTWQTAYSQAYAFEAPLRAVGTGLHPGNLSPAGSFVVVNPETFVISTVKAAEVNSLEKERSHSWLVRGYNIGGDQIIATLRPWRRFPHVELVNLAEEKIANLDPRADGSVSFPVGGHQIVSVMFGE